MVFLKRVINLRYELPYGELQRKEIPEIPYDALREAIINAVTHRDYSVSGACTMVEVFDDRVEISNPGGLPPSLKPEEFGKKSVPRNQVIAEMMMRVGHIEKMGTGIKKMRDLCEEAGNPEPEFQFSGFFTVIFKKVTTPVTTLEKEGTTLENTLKSSEKSSEKILAFIRKSPQISAREIAEKISLTDRAVEKQLAALKNLGKIRRIGPAKGGHWEIVE